MLYNTNTHTEAKQLRKNGLDEWKGYDFSIFHYTKELT
jgi:hypothetical protein